MNYCQSVFIMPLVANPGARAEYSDIGFILLGIALERLADESLDAFCQREIFAALGMTNTAFNPPSKLRTQIPPTVDDRSFRLALFRVKCSTKMPASWAGWHRTPGFFPLPWILPNSLTPC